MGYSYYDTPMGPAGYAVEDICHEPECVTEIDRGLAYLCGNVPGYEWDQYGCGRWYCGDHLYMPPATVRLDGGGLCSRCLTRWKQENPELAAAEEEEFQHRLAKLRGV